MPNHVHVVLTPGTGHPLPRILDRWKSYAANLANRHVGRTGGFWQTEYYDHLIRDEADFAHALRYVAENPSKAGLRNWNWNWKWVWENERPAP
jgi:REP element-mobilizing transposase RayT